MQPCVGERGDEPESQHGNNEIATKGNCAKLPEIVRLILSVLQIARLISHLGV